MKALKFILLFELQSNMNIRMRCTNKFGLYSKYIIYYIFALPLCIFSQTQFDYTVQDFRTDTADLSTFAAPTKKKEKAELIAKAETWNLSFKNYGYPDDFYYDTTRFLTFEGRTFYQKEKKRILKGDLKEYFLFDFNNDGKADIVHTEYLPVEESKISPGGTNYVTFYVSSSSECYYVYRFYGLISNIKKDGANISFTIIYSTCCDEDYTKINLISFAKSGAAYENRIFLTHYSVYLNSKPLYNYFPKYFIKPKLYPLSKEIPIGIRKFDCNNVATYIGLSAMKGDTVLVLSEEQGNYFVAIKPSVDLSACKLDLYKITEFFWCDKNYFESITKK